MQVLNRTTLCQSRNSTRETYNAVNPYHVHLWKPIVLGAVLLLLAGRWALAAERPLGTVFFSPQERAALVTGRQPPTTEVKGAEEVKKAPEPGKKGAKAPPPQSRPFTVSGIVSRKGGKSVIWLNGQPVSEAQPDPRVPPLQLSTDHALIDGKSVKVGETVDIISGKRGSSLPEGAVKVESK